LIQKGTSLESLPIAAADLAGVEVWVNCKIVPKALAIVSQSCLKIGRMESINATSATYEQPRYVLTEYGKLENVGGDGHYDSISTTTDIRDKVIRARLVKCD
jgi:hypothetical protein